MIDLELVKKYSDMDYDKLHVVKTCLEKAPEGVFLEIGTRRGGTALLAASMSTCQFLICVDPYKSFNDMDGNPIEMNENWYIEARLLLNNSDAPYYIFQRTSDEFMNKHSRVPGLGKTTKTLKYSYVLLDGAHTDEIVSREIDYFSKRMASGGVLLVDNTDWLTLDFTGWESPRFDMAYRIF